MRPIVNVLILMLTLLLGAAAVQADPYTGVVSVDSAEAQAGSSFSVAIRLQNNNIAFSALTVPLQYNHPYLTLDSVSFAGSLLPSNWSEAVDHNVTEKTVKVSYVPEFTSPIPTVSAANGIIARLYFHISESATPVTIPIDSINKDSIVAGSLHLITRVQLADNTGLPTGIYEPDFVMGAVKVLVPTGVDDRGGNLPSVFTLDQNYPNPFNPVTVIQFALPRASEVKLEVFNVLGQLVETLVDKQMPAGQYAIDFNAGSRPSGVYFYRLSHDFGSLTRKMILLK
ncbi:MAG: T9SS type A sorting domain-containing protein [candidate division Zixibacteria bacterium]|nr:T9SS type A sorting domain-containing protein [candidate division Zixibacteria bacterium]